MILRRLGNKKALADKIIAHFPEHKVYYELFFGTGSIYFAKPPSRYSIVNDLDSDVFSLFQVVKNNMDEFLELFIVTPMSEQLFYWWKDNKETEPIRKALRFLYLSNFSHLGKLDTFNLIHSQVVHKKKLQALIRDTSEFMQNTTILKRDFRNFFDGIKDGEVNIGKKHRFSYADPIYLDTVHNYGTPDMKEQCSFDLFETLDNSGVRYAMSEFNHPFVMDQAKKRGLNIITIGERQNIKNRRIEMLYTNY